MERAQVSIQDDNPLLINNVSNYCSLFVFRLEPESLHSISFHKGYLLPNQTASSCLSSDDDEEDDAADSAVSVESSEAHGLRVIIGNFRFFKMG